MMIEILMTYRVFQRMLIIQKGFQTVLMIACTTVINEVCVCVKPVYRSSTFHQRVLMIACATLINKVCACAAAVYTSSV